jgi:deoxyribodipyrimidine photolyase-related protein
LKTTNKTLRLIAGDQLNHQHSWFSEVNPELTYVMMEIRSESDYARHHIQKVIGFFATMRHFAEELKAKGHALIYLHLNDSENLQAFDLNILRLVEKFSFTHFEYLLPDEYRVDQHLKNLCEKLSIPSSVSDTEHFLSTREELAQLFKGKKTFLMETFYRHMRRKHHILMQGSEPLTGQWNYDKDNRKKLPAGHKCTSPLVFENNVRRIAEEIEQAKITTIGTVDTARFIWPVSRTQALKLLEFFVQECLPLFGTYEDAMTPDDWSLYHSRLSFALNNKLLSPREVIDAAIREWEGRVYEITYNQLEGFVRQILGWREYMRGIYWATMPQFANLNYFDHQQKLPGWYWTGETKMRCLSHSIKQSLSYAYAHHIQRLMVLGNFALLSGVNPDELDQWFLGIYIDAIEWVEITNTRGMSQFADGGIVGSKPYISSAAYIDKMSHYCGTCYYKKALKTGDKACPFNSLYWNFYDRHQDKLSKNPRISMMYNVWNRMKPDEKAALLQQAEQYIKQIEQL